MSDDSYGCARESRYMRRVVVVQIAKGLGIGGTEKALELYTRYLDPELFDVSVVGFKEGGVRGERLASLGFDVEVMGGSKEKLVRFLRRKKAHVVHVHRPGLSDPAIPEAVQEAEVPVLVETNVFGRLDLSPSGEFFDKHLFVSKTCALRYIDWLGPSLVRKRKSKIGVLYNPVDFSEMESARTVDEQFLEIVQLKSTGARVIGFIARPDPARIEISYVIESLRYALSHGIICYLLAVGMPPVYKSRFEAAGLSEFCIFLEPGIEPSRLAEFYKCADVILNASPIGETFGLVIAEAMASRKPVVTNLTPLHETAQIELVDHGKTGYVAYGSRAYAEAVLYLVMNPLQCAEMGKRGYEKAKAQYDVLKLSNGLGNLYIELLQSKGFSFQPHPVSERAAHQLPSFTDIESFRAEYWDRLQRCWGKVPGWELWMHRILRNRHFFMLARSLKQVIQAKGVRCW